MRSILRRMYDTPVHFIHSVLHVKPIFFPPPCVTRMGGRRQCDFDVPKGNLGHCCTILPYCVHVFVVSAGVYGYLNRIRPSLDKRTLTRIEESTKAAQSIFHTRFSEI